MACNVAYIYQKASSELRKVSVDTATDVYGNGAHGMKGVNQTFDLPSAKCRAAPQTVSNVAISEGNGGESYVLVLRCQMVPTSSIIGGIFPPASTVFIVLRCQMVPSSRIVNGIFPPASTVFKRIYTDRYFLGCTLKH